MCGDQQLGKEKDFVIGLFDRCNSFTSCFQSFFVQSSFRPLSNHCPSKMGLIIFTVCATKLNTNKNKEKSGPIKCFNNRAIYSTITLTSINVNIG